MADLKTLYRAARFHEPLKEELGPVQSTIFEVLQGPTNAPLAWGAILAAIGALFFVGITRLSVPSSVKVVSEPVGAEVLVDGVVKGQAPLVLKDLSHGKHSVEVRQDAFQSKVLSVDIGAFAPRYYSAKLVPVPPKVVEAEEQKQQSLSQIFLTKAPEAKKVEKPSKSQVRAKTPVRVAAR